MPEMTKILISACIGMVAGLGGTLLFEPLKHHIQLKIKSRRIKADIYKELGFLAVTFKLQATRPPADADIVKTYFNMLEDSDSDYYYSREREAFNRIQDHKDIRAFYRLFKLTRETVMEGKINPFTAAQMLIEDLNKRFQAGGLSEKTVQKYATRYVKLLDKQGKKRALAT